MESLNSSRLFFFLGGNSYLGFLEIENIFFKSKNLNKIFSAKKKKKILSNKGYTQKQYSTSQELAQ